MKVSEILNTAADLVEKGWTREKFTDGNGCYCAAGAIRAAILIPARKSPNPLTEDEIEDCETDLAIEAEAAIDGYLGDDVRGWNDAPDRQQAEVATALREAAQEVAA